MEHAAKFPVNTWVSQQRCNQNKWLPCSRRNHTLLWFLRGQCGQAGRPPLWGFWGWGWICMGEVAEVERGSGWWVGAVRSMGACLSSQNGNIRVRSWQPLSLFIVYCLPAPRTVNNGTPSLWALCGRGWSWSWPWRWGCGQGFLQLPTFCVPAYRWPLWTDLNLICCLFRCLVFLSLLHYVHFFLRTLSFLLSFYLSYLSISTVKVLVWETVICWLCKIGFWIPKQISAWLLTGHQAVWPVRG